MKGAKDLLRESLEEEVEEEFETKKIFFVSAREIMWGKLKCIEGCLLFVM